MKPKPNLSAVMYYEIRNNVYYIIEVFTSCTFYYVNCYTDTPLLNKGAAYAINLHKYCIKQLSFQVQNYTFCSNNNMNKSMKANCTILDKSYDKLTKHYAK